MPHRVPTDDEYYVSTSMSGPRSSETLLAPKGTYAYLTQNAYAITITGTQGTTCLYMGEHWNANHLGASTYAFYPVVHNGKTLSLHYTGGWRLNAAAGTWTDLPLHAHRRREFDDTIVDVDQVFGWMCGWRRRELDVFRTLHLHVERQRRRKSLADCVHLEWSEECLSTNQCHRRWRQERRPRSDGDDVVDEHIATSSTVGDFEARIKGRPQSGRL